MNNKLPTTHQVNGVFIIQHSPIESINTLIIHSKKEYPWQVIETETFKVNIKSDTDPAKVIYNLASDFRKYSYDKMERIEAR